MKTGGKLEAQVEVRDLPVTHVAYVRHTGPYKGDAQLFEGLFGQLFQWAGPRGLCREGMQILTVYHDNPDVTDEDKLRISVSLSVDEDTPVDGSIGKMALPGGAYAVARFELGPDQYEEAWTSVYGGWLPQSGYQPDDRPALELYHSDPKQHPEGKCVVDICVPVKPL
jgi:AraC family transcriptional regulator